jgi:hypothetical protein
MGMVMGVTTAILAIAAGLIGLLIWTSLIFASPTARARAALEFRTGRCFLTGVGLTLILGAPVLRLLPSPNGLVKIVGWALLLPLAAALVTGLSAMAQLLGDRLRALSPALTPLGALVRGALIVELAAIIPFLGWFLFAPLVGLTVTGAGVLGCVGRTGSTRMLPRGRPEELEVDTKSEDSTSGEIRTKERVPISPSLLCVLCVSAVPFLR